jgi:hypothetical protein
VGKRYVTAEAVVVIVKIAFEFQYTHARASTSESSSYVSTLWQWQWTKNSRRYSMQDLSDSAQPQQTRPTMPALSAEILTIPLEAGRYIVYARL